MKWVCLSYKSSLKGILQLNFWYLFFQWVSAALPAKSQFDTDGINLSNFDKYVFPNVFTIQFRILFSLLQHCILRATKFPVGRVRGHFLGRQTKGSWLYALPFQSLQSAALPPPPLFCIAMRRSLKWRRLHTLKVSCSEVRAQEKIPCLMYLSSQSTVWLFSTRTVVAVTVVGVLVTVATLNQGFTIEEMKCLF